LSSAAVVRGNLQSSTVTITDREKALYEVAESPSDERRSMDDQRMTLSVDEAARMLGISRGFAYRAAREGKLPTVRVGHRVLVPRRSLDAFLAAGKGVGQDDK